MKIEVKSAYDCSAFIRESMLETMHRSIASMRRCGSSEADIELLIADTMTKISEACVDIEDAFAALKEESFDDVPKVLN
jgi:hypothetical protein